MSRIKMSERLMWGDLSYKKPLSINYKEEKNNLKSYKKTLVKIQNVKKIDNLLKKVDICLLFLF